MFPLLACLLLAGVRSQQLYDYEVRTITEVDKAPCQQSTVYFCLSLRSFSQPTTPQLPTVCDGCLCLLQDDFPHYWAEHQDRVLVAAPHQLHLPFSLRFCSRPVPSITLTADGYISVGDSHNQECGVQLNIFMQFSSIISCSK